MEKNKAEEIIKDDSVSIEEEENVLESNKKVKVKREKGEKSLFSRIINVVLWIVLFGWMFIVVLDYYKVTNEKEPVFCLSKKTTEYADGNVKSCTGLGYKAYKYDRESYKAIEFGPFWTQDKSAKADNK